ncbi:Metallo-dependent hydrolase [Wolfiporia cocos MD-104 SS10]|uniref:Metallo-dependent hydrolase n=1 Tax=Wolfiporia cocos (strain MD-104) TaxID=742152 RepID=A0A2H3J697_WOLCO|nr:Metallo-dependent hydrolase [Wolfiporia cocos MD-104 SS10]
MATHAEHTIAGPAAAALASLTPAQLHFLRALPKAELHAHLNGSIPLPALQDLANQYLQTEQEDSDAVRASIAQLQAGVTLNEIHEFFGLFPAIYALTSTPTALAQAARAVLAHFLLPRTSLLDPDPASSTKPSSPDGKFPEAAYLELRTTPRETSAMSRMKYVETVLDEVERYPADRAALIVSLDRRMSADVAAECVRCAVQLKEAGRRVVGIDLCGDVKAGDMTTFEAHFREAKAAGLGVTLHIAETEDTPVAEIHTLLSFNPDRLGHATFLDTPMRELVRSRKTCIEICLSSNLLCKTVPVLADHHVRWYLREDHPVAICTDDILPFRNSLLGEYALLMAAPPLGLGLTEAEVERVARMAMECRFRLGSRMES